MCLVNDEYFVERVVGIEPTASVWKTEILTTIRYPPKRHLITNVSVEDRPRVRITLALLTDKTISQSEI